MAILICTKLLTKTDVQKRMSFPTKSLRSLPSFSRARGGGGGGGGQRAVSFQAMDGNGILWTFGCSIRKKGRHPNPVLSRGWLAFVAYNNLQTGDKVEFYQEIPNPLTGALRYKIKVKKAVKVFGVVFGYVPSIHGLASRCPSGLHADDSTSSSLTTNQKDLKQ